MSTTSRAMVWLAALLCAAGAALAVTPSNELAGKKAVLVIAPSRFRDEELAHPSDILKAKGCKVVVACSALDEAKGMRGAKVKPDVLLADVKAEDYDAVVFIGGTGARVYFDDPTAHALAKAAAEKGKVLAAICFAPSILARAGVLKGVPATAYRSRRRDLENHGARWVSQSVVRKGRIITANGPRASTKFGQFLVMALKGNEE